MGFPVVVVEIGVRDDVKVCVNTCVKVSVLVIVGTGV